MKIKCFPRMFVYQMVVKGIKPYRDLLWAMISIYSTPKEILFTDNYIQKAKDIGCTDILNICFADIEVPLPDEDKYKDYKLFDDSDALNIIQFLLHQCRGKVDYLVVHCDAGISRSGAVGLFAQKHFGTVPYEDFKRFNPHILPNNHVYNTLSSVYINGWWDFS